MEPATSLLRLVICQIPPHRLSFVLLLSVLLLLLTIYPLSTVASTSFQPRRQRSHSLLPSTITAYQCQHHCLSSSFHIASPALLLNGPFQYHYVAGGSIFVIHISLWSRTSPYHSLPPSPTRSTLRTSRRFSKISTSFFPSIRRRVAYRRLRRSSFIFFLLPYFARRVPCIYIPQPGFVESQRI